MQIRKWFLEGLHGPEHSLYLYPDLRLDLSPFRDLVNGEHLHTAIYQIFAPLPRCRPEENPFDTDVLLSCRPTNEDIALFLAEILPTELTDIPMEISLHTVAAEFGESEWETLTALRTSYQVFVWGIGGALLLGLILLVLSALLAAKISLRRLQWTGWLLLIVGGLLGIITVVLSFGTPLFVEYLVTEEIYYGDTPLALLQFGASLFTSLVLAVNGSALIALSLFLILIGSIVLVSLHRRKIYSV
jgi:hypothetical protein